MITKFLFPLLFSPADGTGAAPNVTIPENNNDDAADVDLLGEGADDDTNNDDASNEGEEDEEGDADGAGEDGEEGDANEGDEEEDENLTEEEKAEKLKADKEKKDKKKKDEEETDDLVRHSYSAIKKEFPELFKKFPGLKQAFFREQEFTKIFPTVDEARAAVQAQENFEVVRDSVLKGDAEAFLTQVKEASPQALEHFSSNFLTDLRKVDKDMYIEVTTPVIRGVLQQAFNAARSSKDENLQAAAKVIHQAIFGGDYDDISHEVGRAARKKEDDPEKLEFEKERNTFYQGKFTALRTEVWADVERTLTSEIEKGLDPTNSIRPGLKKMLVSNIFAEVTNKVSQDAAHVARMNGLWQREKKNGFSGLLKDSIKTTYLSRAKAIMPAIRQRIRSEAVETQKVNDKDKKDKVNRNNNDRRPDAGASPRNGKKTITAKEANQKRMSDMDILNS